MPTGAGLTQFQCPTVGRAGQGGAGQVGEPPQLVRPLTRNSVGEPGRVRCRLKVSPQLCGAECMSSHRADVLDAGLWQCHGFEFHAAAYGHKAGFPGITRSHSTSLSCSTGNTAQGPCGPPLPAAPTYRTPVRPDVRRCRRQGSSPHMPHRCSGENGLVII